MISKPFGLVLSGGGAKGAYQAGVVKALAELGVEISSVAGASIGALNGAIVASAPNLRTGAERLEEVWLELAKTSPMKLRAQPLYLVLLASAGLALSQTSLLTALIAHSKFSDLRFGSPSPASSNDGALLSTEPLRRMLDKHLDVRALQEGLDFFVSVYPYPGLLESAIELSFAEFGIQQNRSSDFLHIQSLPESERRSALLASAALPALFDPQEIGGNLYTDGGQGGWRCAQGNTPIQPLIDAGENRIIVTHLSDGSLWSRHNFPDTVVIEIRPQKPIARGSFDLMGFNSTNISSWMTQGYEDTLTCWNKVEKAVNTSARLESSFSDIDAARNDGTLAEAELALALARIEQLE